MILNFWDKRLDLSLTKISTYMVWILLCNEKSFVHLILQNRILLSLNVYILLFYFRTKILFDYTQFSTFGTSVRVNTEEILQSLENLRFFSMLILLDCKLSFPLTCHGTTLCFRQPSLCLSLHGGCQKTTMTCYGKWRSNPFYCTFWVPFIQEATIALVGIPTYWYI